MPISTYVNADKKMENITTSSRPNGVNFFTDLGTVHCFFIRIKGMNLTKFSIFK